MEPVTKIILLLKSRGYCESLAAVLSILPGVEIFCMKNIPHNLPGWMDRFAPDILMVDSNHVDSEYLDALNAGRKARPSLKIVLLSQPAAPSSDLALGNIDLVLRSDCTAGELLQSISRLMLKEPQIAKTTPIEHAIVYF